MQNRNLLALAILSGLLTACGGGDDDSNNPADPKNNPPPLQGPSPASANTACHSAGDTGDTDKRLPLRTTSIPASAGTSFNNVSGKIAANARTNCTMTKSQRGASTDAFASK